MPKKVLITGAGGFIGSHLLARILDDTDWDVVCLDRLDHAGTLERIGTLPSFARERRRVEVVFHDLRAELGRRVSRLVVSGRDCFGSQPFDHVIHLAAGSHVDRSVADPSGFVRDNVLGTAHLLDFARGHARHVLYFSTDEVFGSAPAGVSFREEDRMHPLNPYAASKAGGELLCPSYANTYGLGITVTRCANVFGEGQDEEKFLPLCVRKITAGETVQIHARKTGRVLKAAYLPSNICPPNSNAVWCSPNETRTTPFEYEELESSSRLYTHHRNVTSAVLTVLEKGDRLNAEDPRAGRYNIEGGEEISNLEVARKIAALLGRVLKSELVEDPPGRPRPDMRYAIDSSRLRALGWAPEKSFDEGLREFVRDEREKLLLRESRELGHRAGDGFRRTCDALLLESMKSSARFDRLEEDG